MNCIPTGNLAPLRAKEIDRLLVTLGKANYLLTDHLYYLLHRRSEPVQE